MHLQKYQERALVAQSNACLRGDQVAGEIQPGPTTIFPTDHEIVSMVILSLPLVKKGSCQSLAKDCTSTD